MAPEEQGGILLSHTLHSQSAFWTLFIGAESAGDQPAMDSVEEESHCALNVGSLGFRRSTSRC